MGRSRPRIHHVAAIAVVVSCLRALGAEEAPGPRDGPSRSGTFSDAKTFFQTNVPYDPRIALAVDAVVVHRHGDRRDSLERAIRSWKEKGYAVGRMFFADSDATNAYWTGKWDGTPHPDEVERDAAGNVVKCAGVRPYMLPTEGWIRHLEEMARTSVEAGADAILPEEPLAHAHTGYEGAFREIWARRYGRPWQPESASAEARFLTARLKNELYVELERRLSSTTRAEAERTGRPLSFVLPIHSIYSNVAAGLVAPLGTSLGIDADGYVGQVWTGPVNWALAHYDSPEESFFASAYALYDYFVELVAGSSKRLWLLGDPVEDDPRHEWREFERWYRHCVVAKLLFPEASAFEVMPWPDRIFLPGYGTGGGTPAPESYRIVILSAVQALQEMPAGGLRCRPAADVPEPEEARRVGIAIADTLLWEKEPPPALQGVYGLLFPLIQRGAHASVFIAERSGDEAYRRRFGAVVVSFEAWKPADPSFGRQMASWVRGGGSLVVLGEGDDLGGAPFWWRELGHRSPLEHLLSELGVGGDDGDSPVGAGWVLRRRVSPRRFADPATARDQYLPVVDLALRKAGASGLATPGNFCLHRGSFVVAHAMDAPLDLSGDLVDVLDPDLPLLAGARIEPGSSGLYRDVGTILHPPDGKAPEPEVLHATHRIIERRDEGPVLRAVVRGPAETPGVLRLFSAGRQTEGVEARDPGGRELPVDRKEEGPTIRLRFPNCPEGVTIEVRWKS